MKNKICEIAERDDIVYESEVMEAFRKRCQHLHDRADSWEEYGPFEVLVRLKNGDVYLYNHMDDRRLTRVYLTSELGEVKEIEWRKWFAYSLRKELEKARIDQNELAERIGVSNITVSHYMNGKNTPSGYMIWKISEALGCSFEKLLIPDFIPLR